ncbi:DUF4384 domain-containing protein [candidate division KSB1 bacterium]|nr:DUF4384 domain-containing protein [candidate division KSB1 bacterium]
MRYILSVLFLLFVVVTSWSQTTKVAVQPADSTPEKYSTIVEADGYAFISEDEPLKKIREKALANAKREALERGQTYIKSITQVENYMLTYDLIESGSEGYVTILDGKDHGIQPDNRYRYWIRAEIEYKIGQPEMPEKATAKGPLTVEVTTAKTSYAGGEEMQVQVKGNKDFYGRIVYVDVSGNIIQLLPNQHRKDHFFKGGVTYRIPDKEKGDRFSLTVQPPYGEEKIIVYASNVDQGEVDMDETDDGLYAYRGSLGNLGHKTRSIAVTPALGKAQAAEFFEAVCNVVTTEK